MNDETANEPQRAQGGPTSAVSVFGQAGNMADFPVLKAFQEYVDAEQAKSRKRMLGLSVFFVILLIVVVVTFTLVLTTVINRNQSLSDRLLDVALRERAAADRQLPAAAVQPQPAPAPAADDSVVKPLLKKLESLAEAISESARQKLQPPAPAPAVPQAAPAPTTAVAQPAVSQPAVSQPAEALEMLRLREELRRRHEALDAERQKIKEAREKLKEDRHQAEVEQHRRRLYPEHYARKDAEKAKGQVRPAANAAPAATPASAGQKPAPAARPAAPNPPAAGRPQGTGKAIDYFKQNEGDDEELAELVRKTNEVRRRAEARKAEGGKANAAAKPTAAEKPAARPAPASEGQKPASDAGGKKSERKTETVVIGEKGGDSIPWLLNSPEGSK